MPSTSLVSANLLPKSHQCTNLCIQLVFVNAITRGCRTCSCYGLIDAGFEAAPFDDDVGPSVGAVEDGDDAVAGWANAVSVSSANIPSRAAAFYVPAASSQYTVNLRKRPLAWAYLGKFSLFLGRTL